MDADLEPDIAEKGPDQREEGTRKKVNGRLRHIREILVQDPGPPIEDHRDDIGNDAFSLIAEVHRGHEKFQPPHHKHRKQGEKDVTGQDCNKPEYAGYVVEFSEGHRMDEDEEGHHIAAYKKGMEEIRKKTRGKSRSGHK
jgi:hypothetical protein